MDITLTNNQILSNKRIEGQAKLSVKEYYIYLRKHLPSPYIPKWFINMSFPQFKTIYWLYNL